MESVEKKVKCARVFAELLASGGLIKVVLFDSVACDRSKNICD
jgi:hypothetical protein